MSSPLRMDLGTVQPGRCGHRPLRRRYVSPRKRATARVAPTKRSKAFGKTGRRGRRPPRHSVEKRCVGADASVRPPDLYRISCDVSLRSQCARWSRNPYSFCRAGYPHPATASSCCVLQNLCRTPFIGALPDISPRNTAYFPFTSQPFPPAAARKRLLLFILPFPACDRWGTRFAAAPRSGHSWQSGMLPIHAA